MPNDTRAGNKAQSPDERHAGFRRWHFGRRSREHPTLGVFTVEEESQFRKERNAEASRMLQTALVLGAGSFFAFAVLDTLTRNLSFTAFTGRVLIVAYLGGLLLWLRRPHDAQSPVDLQSIAAFAAAISAGDLLALLWIEQDPARYSETWPGLLPIYFIVYGQLIVSVRAALLLGSTTLIIIPATGYLIGVAMPVLASSALMLAIVNLFGLLTRCRLEAFSRRSFAARRAAERDTTQRTDFIQQVSHNLRQPLQP